MAGLIPQAFIDDLVARADIVEVIDARVPLKKAGREYKACCPFHDEKTPSFTVSPEKQFYHCFGCGAHGTVLRFLTEYERVEFPEAVEELAQAYGLEVPREGGAAPDPSRGQDALAMLAQACTWFKRQLRQHAGAERAKRYLQGRGLSGRTAAAFEIGYAPPGWDNLWQALGDQGRALAALRDAGLVTERDAGRPPHDRFRDRVMFPIHDRRGRVVGFGARALGDDEPKYLNSPETPVFHKGRELYGLFQTRRTRSRADLLIAVEGYMDVLMLVEHGIDQVCATLGTAATEEQVERMFKACADVVFCFDGDAAGQRAAWRAMENALPLMRDGRRARFMFLPQGEDPDSFVRSQGRDAFEALLAQAPTLTTFLFDRIAAHSDLRSAEGQARAKEEAAPLIRRLPDGTLRTLATRRLAELIGLSLDRTEDELGLRPAAGPGRTAGPARPMPGVISPARRAVTLLLHHPRLAGSAGDVDDLRTLDTPGASLLADIVAALSQRPELTTAGLVERFREHRHGAALAQLAAGEAPELTEALADEFRDCLQRLRHAPLEARFHALRALMRDGRASAVEAREYASLAQSLGRGRGTARDGAPD